MFYNKHEELHKKLREIKESKESEELVVKMGPVNVEGTTKRGEMPAGTEYRELIQVFGKPTELNPGDGVWVEWNGTINGKVFTIYDYNLNIKPEDNQYWTIGGHDNTTAMMLYDYFKRQLGCKDE